MSVTVLTGAVLMTNVRQLLKTRLSKNISSLFVIKISDYFLAFITFPYLARVLQPEKFGAIFFAQAVLQYFVLFTNYGFNLTGPKEVACCNDRGKLGQVVSEIFGAKILLLLISFLVFVVGITVLSFISTVDVKLYAVMFLMVIGSVMFPVWFFQGVQQMWFITIANLAARFCSVAAIFVFVRTSADYLMAATFQSIAPCVSGLIACLVLKFKFSMPLVFPEFKNIFRQLKESWDLFFSNLAINLYTVSNTVFLGMLTTPAVVGFYSGARKIIDSALQLYGPVSQALYPHVCRMASESGPKTLAFLKKVFFAVMAFNLIISLTLFLGADLIVKILLGPGYESAVIILRIMSPVPLIIAASNVFGIQIMLPFGLKKVFSKIIVCASVLNLIIIIPAIILFEAAGVSMVVLITELFVTVTMGLVLFKRRQFLLEHAVSFDPAK